jgi:hypothetical protein
LVIEVERYAAFLGASCRNEEVYLRLIDEFFVFFGQKLTDLGDARVLYLRYHAVRRDNTQNSFLPSGVLRTRPTLNPLHFALNPEIFAASSHSASFA